MRTVVNGTERELDAGTTIERLVHDVLSGLPARGVAVALNGEVVPRSEWTSTPVAEGDRIEVLTAVGGG